MDRIKVGTIDDLPYPQSLSECLQQSVKEIHFDTFVLNFNREEPQQFGFQPFTSFASELLADDPSERDIGYLYVDHEDEDE